jgi:L-histidine Nalpha-methyltransferase
MSPLKPAYREKWFPSFETSTAPHPLPHWMGVASLNIDPEGRRVDFHDLHPPPENLLQEVETGLQKTPKSIPPKFFYDEKGSDLFHQITQLPEYYLTRTEVSLLFRIQDEVAECIGGNAHLIEYGCGSSQKVRLLLDALDRPRTYFAVDISKFHLLSLCQTLAVNYPEMTVAGICADFTTSFPLPPLAEEGRKIAFFPGSSIGNFEPGEAVHFLKNIRSTLGPDSGLLIGVDLKKAPALLHAAYNDAKGVTARFNLNLLERINRECGADFRPFNFKHRAFYNEDLGRIEMHLVSLRGQSVSIGGRRTAFRKDESIHTENSYKYSVPEFQDLARQAGWIPSKVWKDEKDFFSIHFLI